MPRKFVKKMYRKKRSFRRPFNKGQVKAIRKIALRSGEIKELVGSLSDGSIVTASANPVAISYTMAQGDGEGERIGDEITIKDISVNMVINSGTANGSIRVIFYQKLSDTTDLTSNMTDINDYYPSLKNSTGAYKILYDRNFQLDPDGVSNKFVRVKFNKQLKVHKINYDAGASTFNNTGTVLGLILTNNATASQITMTGKSRIRYYDS